MERSWVCELAVGWGAGVSESERLESPIYIFPLTSLDPFYSLLFRCVSRIVWLVSH